MVACNITRLVQVFVFLAYAVAIAAGIGKCKLSARRRRFVTQSSFKRTSHARPGKQKEERQTRVKG